MADVIIAMAAIGAAKALFDPAVVFGRRLIILRENSRIVLERVVSQAFGSLLEQNHLGAATERRQRTRLLARPLEGIFRAAGDTEFPLEALVVGLKVFIDD